MALIDLTNQTFGRLTVLYRDIKTEALKKDISVIIISSIKSRINKKAHSEE